MRPLPAATGTSGKQSSASPPAARPRPAFTQKDTRHQPLPQAELQESTTPSQARRGSRGGIGTKTRGSPRCYFLCLSRGFSANSSHASTANPITTPTMANQVPSLSMSYRLLLPECSKRQFGKAASSEDGEAYVVQYVEPLSAARTQPNGFFNILVGRTVTRRPSTCRGASPCHYRPWPVSPTLRPQDGGFDVRARHEQT